MLGEPLLAAATARVLQKGGSFGGTANFMLRWKMQKPECVFEGISSCSGLFSWNCVGYILAKP